MGKGTGILLLVIGLALISLLFLSESPSFLGFDKALFLYIGIIIGGIGLLIIMFSRPKQFR